MLKLIKKHLYQLWKYQWIDNRGVETQHKFVDNVFYLDSEAGLIVYKPKTQIEADKFRNDIVNRIHSIGNDKKKSKKLFRLYKDARKKYRVSWKANTRTRLRSLVKNAI